MLHVAKCCWKIWFPVFGSYLLIIIVVFKTEGSSQKSWKKMYLISCHVDVGIFFYIYIIISSHLLKDQF